MPVMYVSPTGSGDKSGSSWANAAAVTSLDKIIGKAGADGTVKLAADAGVYAVKSPIAISGSNVLITAANRDGSAGEAVFEGSRAHDWSVGKTAGNELFKIAKGADGLTFENLQINNTGVAFRVGGDVKDLEIRHVDADNVQRFFEDYASGGNKTATISGLTIRDVEVSGFSKNVIRLQYDTNNVLIEDVRGDSERQDGDNFAMGVHLDDTVHNVVFRRVTMDNATQDRGKGLYWNGDGFATERGTYNILFQDTVARGNTDGGYDVKSSHVVFDNALAEGNGRNYRVWGQDVVIKNSKGLDPEIRGGSSSQQQLWVGEGGQVTVIGSEFRDAGTKTTVFDNKGKLTLINTAVVAAQTAQLLSGVKATGMAELAVERVVATGLTSNDAVQSDGSLASPLTPTAPNALVEAIVVDTTGRAGDWVDVAVASGSRTIAATARAERFMIDQATAFGAVVVKGWEPNDLLVFKTKLGDANDDGLTDFGKDKMLDLRPGATLNVEGLEKALRFLGETEDGFVYGDSSIWKLGATVPTGAAVGRFVSGAANETFMSTNARETFFFDVSAGKTGTDSIRGFGSDDVVVTSRALADGNRDGVITAGRNGFDLGDKVSVVRTPELGTAGLRALGMGDDGYVYADLSVRPKGALEGKLSANDMLTGGKGDTATDRFFIDTALHRALGEDKAVNFGAKDVIITTSALDSISAGGVIGAEGGAFRLVDDELDLGGMRVTNTDGRAVDQLEFDGSRIVNGVEYFVYSTVGSAIGLDALGG
jgi:hypothetical protein